MKIRSIANDEHFTDRYYLPSVYAYVRDVLSRRLASFPSSIFSNNMFQLMRIMPGGERNSLGEKWVFETRYKCNDEIILEIGMLYLTYKPTVWNSEHFFIK